MGLRSILVALVGVTVAGASAFATREFLTVQTAQAERGAGADLVTMVFAGTDIPYGQIITAQSLKMMPWPRAAVPAGAFTDVSSLLPPPGQPPRRAVRAMSVGDPVLAAKISNFGEKVTIVQSLGQNTRAMAIKVDAETAVGGFVTPGDSVDVVLTQGRDAELKTVTILQNIRVVGVDQESDQKQDQPEVARTVTVEISPEQGQVLALAQKAGTLSLTLRTLDAAMDRPLEAIRLVDILREKSPVPTPVAAKMTVKVRRGNDAVELVEVNN